MASPVKKPLRLIHLEVENIKRLKAVAIDPTGHVIEITGANGAGKTSLLDSLWWALAGTTDIQRSPIRKGEESARIFLDLGEIKVTRRFTKKEGGYTTSIVVENADGARYQSPQSILDALITELTIDPLSFTRADPKSQINMLKGLAPNVKFEEIEAATAKDYEARTEVNRQIKYARAQAAAIAVPDGTPAEEIDEDALTRQLTQAGEHNANIEARKGRREQLVRDIERRESEAAGLDARAADLRRQADELGAKAVELRAEVGRDQARLAAAEPLPEPIDVHELSNALARARDINGAVRNKRELERLQSVIAARETEAAELTKAIADREELKRKAIAEAKIPVDGIGFGDGYLTLNDQPFDQASDAEQLRAAIQIAIAGNPKLRLIRVRDGSLLGKDSWALLEQMAETLDFQVLVETVESNRKGAIVIEDGMVARQPEMAAPE